MTKQIPGYTPPKKKLLSPLVTYEVDIGRTKPIIIEANRVDLIQESLHFIIEYNEHNTYVAGFTKWKSYQIKREKEPPITSLKPKKKKAPSKTT